MKPIFNRKVTCIFYYVCSFLGVILSFLYFICKILGFFFVCFVILFKLAVVSVAYTILIPFYWDNYPVLLVPLLILGHYLLINVIFYYYYCLRTNPGTPLKELLENKFSDFCKKCNVSKPPRTHHCSICNCCILKMDHHCPWLNNCVGHYNHRYFFMYTAYTVCAILFSMLVGFEITYNEYYYGSEDYLVDLKSIPEAHYNQFNFSLDETSSTSRLSEDFVNNDESENNVNWKRVSILFVSSLLTGIFFALLILTLWHARLISKGETSVEFLINHLETEKHKKKLKIYKNPYDLGIRKNWLFFLGLREKFSIFDVILPSTRKPIGNGLDWSWMYFDNNEDAPNTIMSSP